MTEYTLDNAVMGMPLGDIAPLAKYQDATIAIMLDGTAIDASTVVGDYGIPYEEGAEGCVEELYDAEDMTDSGELAITVTRGPQEKTYTITLTNSVPDTRVYDLRLGIYSKASEFVLAEDWDPDATDSVSSHAWGSDCAAPAEGRGIQQAYGAYNLGNNPSYGWPYVAVGKVRNPDGSLVFENDYENRDSRTSSTGAYNYVTGSHDVDDGSAWHSAGSSMSTQAVDGQNVLRFTCVQKKYDTATTDFDKSYVVYADVCDVELATLGVGAATLSPSFAASTTEYTATTGNASNMVTATLADSANSTLKIEVSKDGGGTWEEIGSGDSVTWAPGNVNIVRLTVTSGLDATVSTVYTVAVEKTGTSTLRAFALGDMAFTPTFDGDTTEYSLDATGTTSAQLQVAANDTTNCAVGITYGEAEILALEDGLSSYSGTLTLGSGGDLVVTCQYGGGEVSVANRHVYTLHVTA